MARLLRAIAFKYAYEPYGFNHCRVGKDFNFSTEAIVDLDESFAKYGGNDEVASEKDGISSRRKGVLGMIRSMLVEASGKHEVELALNQRICKQLVWDYKLLMQLQEALEAKPSLALQVLNWRRRQKPKAHMRQRDYTYGISLAGKVNNLQMAAEMFEEAMAAGFHRKAEIFNAMASSYEKNGLLEKAWAVYEDMKNTWDCKPTPVTFNILLAVAKQLGPQKTQLLEKALMDSGLCLTVQNFDGLLDSYGDAKMWDKVEETMQKMKTSALEPQLSTYIVLAKTYAQADCLEKLEEVRQDMKKHMLSFDRLTRTAMVHAYSRSNIADKSACIRDILEESSSDIEKIVSYAQVNYVEDMEAFLEKAFNNKTRFKNAIVLEEVAALYFRLEALDKLETLLERARKAKWEFSRRVYHCLLSMYGKAKRFDDMEKTFKLMQSSGCAGCLPPGRKAFLIMYKAYREVAKEDELQSILQRMRIAGYNLPLELQS
eukprot:Gb_04061 [translate_table: standard]